MTIDNIFKKMKIAVSPIFVLTFMLVLSFALEANASPKKCIDCVIREGVKHGALFKYGKNLPDTTTRWFSYTKPVRDDLYPTVRVCYVECDTIFVCHISDIDCSTSHIWLKIVMSQDNLGIDGLVSLDDVSSTTDWLRFSSKSIYGKVCRELTKD